MLYAQSPTDQLNELGRKVTEHSRRVMELARPHGEIIEHDLVRNLYQDEPRHAVFFVASGILHAEPGDRVIFYFEPGDLIGMHAFTDSFPATIRSMEPVTLLRVDADTLRKNAGPSESWQDYLTAQGTFYAECCCASVEDDSSPKAGFRRYNEGNS